MKTLKNRVALVTGAGSGIGRATAVAFAQAGCHVIANDICPNALQEAESLITQYGTVLTLCHDVTDPEQVAWLCTAARDSFGPIDILVNNAGMAMGGYIATVPLADWEKLMRLNFWAYVYTTKAVLPQMLERGNGHLVYVSSISGLLTSPNSLPYGTSKFAVVALAESVAAQVRPQGIGVSLVCPGTTQTQIADSGRYYFSSDVETANAKRWFKKAVNQGVPAEKVAQKIVRGVEKDQYLVLTHTNTRLLMIFRALFPELYLRFGSWFHKKELARASVYFSRRMRDENQVVESQPTN